MNPEDALQRLRALEAMVIEGENAKRQLAEIRNSLNQAARAAAPQANFQAPHSGVGISTAYYPPSIQQQQQPDPRPPASDLNTQAELTLQRSQHNISQGAVRNYQQQEQYGAPRQPQNGSYQSFNSNQGSVQRPESYPLNSSYQNGAPKNPYIHLVQQTAQTQLPVPPHNSVSSSNRPQQQASQMANTGYLGHPSGYAPAAQSTHTPAPQRPLQQSHALLPPAANPSQVTQLLQQAQSQQVVLPSRPAASNTRPSQYNNRVPTHASGSAPTRPQPTHPSTLPVPVQGLPPPTSNAPVAPKDRVVQLPSLTEGEFHAFRAQIAAWGKKAPVGHYIDLYKHYGFGQGYILSKLVDGIFMVDVRDHMKCSLSTLFKEIEKRRKPEPPASSSSNRVLQPQISTGPPDANIAATPKAQKEPTAAIPIAARSPALANKKTLAKDILLALGKRTRGSAEAASGPNPKRLAASNLVGVPTSRLSLPETVPSQLTSQPAVTQLTAAPSVERNISPYPPLPMKSIPVESTKPSDHQPEPCPSPVAPTAVEANARHVTPPLSASVEFPMRTSSPTQEIVAEAVAQHVMPFSSASAERPALENIAHLEQPSSGLIAEPVQKQISAEPMEPNVPPIATIDELVSSSSRASTPIPKLKSSSPSAVESEAAAYPPPSSSPNIPVTVPPISSPQNDPVVSRSIASRKEASPAMLLDKQSESSEEALFLPSNSPPSSPALSIVADISAPSAFANEEGGRMKGGQRAYVLIPPPSPRTARVMQLQPTSGELRRLKRGSGTTSRGSSSRGTTVVGGSYLDAWPDVDEVYDNIEEEYDFSYDAQGNKIEDPNEQALMKVAYTRLQASPCKWDRCDANMNSIKGLLTHLKKQHRPKLKSGNSYFLCKWSLCGKQCRYHDRHFLKHALESLICPYAGCDEKFRSIGQVRRHVDKHAENASLKPSCDIFHPSDLAPPQETPNILPSYMVVARRVGAAVITPEKHADLYPWVLKNVVGLVKVKQPRQRRGRALKGLSHSGAPDDVMFDRYAFLTDHPTRYSIYLSEPGDVRADDIPENPEISQISIDGGITILEEGTTEGTIALAKDESRAPSPSGNLERSATPEVPNVEKTAAEKAEGRSGLGDELLEERLDQVESVTVASMLL